MVTDQILCHEFVSILFSMLNVYLSLEVIDIFYRIKFQSITNNEKVQIILHSIDNYDGISGDSILV